MLIRPCFILFLCLSLINGGTQGFRRVFRLELLLPSLTPETPAPKLGSYNVDLSSITVSGASSGAAFATQFHFIFSSLIKGAGMFAGGPYLCGYLDLTEVIKCMARPDLQNVTSFINQAKIFAKEGLIDTLDHIKGSKAYIFSGEKDHVVNPGSGRNAGQMYEWLGADVKGVFNIPAEHGQPIDATSYGGPCGTLNREDHFMNRCGYNGAYEMFRFFYGDEIRKPEPNYMVADGNLVEFDQSEFIPKLDRYLTAMHNKGQIYVPEQCKSGTKKCRLHIAFHGCLSSRQFIGDDYATKSQYIETAQLNDIIIIFPQTKITVFSIFGCWDWAGVTGTKFPTKFGPQPKALYRIIKRVIGNDDVRQLIYE